MLILSTLFDINDTLTKDEFIKLVIEWNQGSPHSNIVIPGIEWNGERNVRYGEKERWLDIEEYRNKNIVAVRYERKEEDGVVWGTEFVMNFNAMKMAIRLDRSFTADALDANPKFETPHFIKLLIDRGHIKDDQLLPVLCSAIEIDENNVSLLIDLINGNAQYSLPVVYVSKTQYDKDPVNVSSLAYRLKGVAHVLVEKEKRLNKTIRDKCSGRNEYLGAIGIYYPTKAIGHRKYLYRSAVGYDSFLYDKVFKSVIQYCNSQMMDTLFTWQGVNNALLRDRLISQREERLVAEKAQHAAEAEITKLLDTQDEEERRIRKKAIEDANVLLDSFEEDMKKLQDQIAALTRENEALQAENHGLKTKLDSSDSTPVLLMGDEFEFYPGEIKDLILATLTEALESIQLKSRRADVIRDIIRHNDYQKLSLSKANELKRILKSYDGMSAKTRAVLKDLGFEISDAGKHYKVSYYGDGRYQSVYGKTPGDVRSGKNNAQQTINMVF